MKIVKNKINGDVILSNHKLSDKEIIRAYSRIVKKITYERAIYKRALELACNEIQDMYCSDYCVCTRCCYEKYYNKEQFLDKAKKELEECKDGLEN